MHACVMSDRVRPPPVEAVPAATVLILRDDPFEVLMVRRRTSSFFSSALVFPGGVVEAEDHAEDWLPHLSGAEALSDVERALRVAACREVYEETSVLLGAGAPPARGERFFDIVRSAGARLPVGDLARFGHWITPEMAKKRFDTHFYLCAAPEGVEAVCDEDETVSLEWVRPGDVVEEAVAGERTILFPTLMNLRRLAESNDVAGALAAARERPVFTVLPRVEMREHGLVVVIPEEAGYGLTEFAAPEVAGRPPQ